MFNIWEKWVSSAEKVRVIMIYPPMNESDLLAFSNLQEKHKCYILHLTLQGLNTAVTKFTSNTKIDWHRVDFNYISVAARIVQVHPTLILNDNTSLYYFDSSKKTQHSQIFVRGKYYEFIFEITPYSKCGANLVRVQLLSPQEVSIHMMKTISEELFARAHCEIIENGKKAEIESAKQQMAFVRKILLEMNQFTVEDLKNRVDMSQRRIETIIEKLCEKGEIGDCGDYYMVIDIQEKPTQADSSHSKKDNSH